VDDVIEISGLRARAIIGIHDWERRVRQEIEITIRLYADTRRAARSDRIEEAVNYRSVAKRVLEVAESSSYHLIEALAHEIARVCVVEFGLGRVSITVEKPGAIRFARTVGVTVERTREDFQ
jgi:FolB domain-containing protein